MLKIEDVNRRLEKIENQNKEGIIAIIEILSNASFFGEIKQATCVFARDGQCSRFTLDIGAKDKIPVVSGCKIHNCKETSSHYHMDLSKLTCGLCQNNQNSGIEKALKIKSKRTKNRKQAKKRLEE